MKRVVVDVDEIPESSGGLALRISLTSAYSPSASPDELEAAEAIFRSLRAAFVEPDRTIIHDERHSVEFHYALRA